MLDIVTNTISTLLLALPADPLCWSGFSRGMGGMWGFGAFGMVFMVLFWGALIFLAVWGITRFATGRATSPSETSYTPLEILNKRLASGEINEAEYEKIRKKLSEK